MSDEKRILVISYHFPPAAGVKIQRMVKLVKYLQEFGYCPIVLAPSGEKRHGLDYESLEEIRDRCELHRAPLIDLTRPLFALRDWLRRRRNRRQLAAVQADATPRGLPRRILALFFFPDPVILWYLPALVKGYKLVKAGRIDLILSSSPPFTSHLIARTLSRLTRKPLVVDLRDLWMDNPFVQSPTELHRRIGRCLEQKVLDSADYLVCATTALKEVLARVYGEKIERKSVVIFNGFDPADFAEPVDEDEQSFTIVHGGSVLLASGRDHSPLTKGFLTAAQADKEFARMARLLYFGFLDGPNLSNLERLKTSSEEGERIKYLGHIPHRQAIETIRRAKVLVFIAGREIDSAANVLKADTETHSVAAKLFEYLACEKPVLLIGDSCPTVDLALKCGVGFWCQERTAEAVAEKLLELFQRSMVAGEKLAPNRKLIAGYSRRVQAGEFAGVFDRALSRSKTWICS